jgi:hypothetical protein
MGTQQFASVPYALHAQNAGNAWSLNGNSATSNNSLGTTNAQDLRLITNNTVSAVLKSNGQFGLGTTTPTGWLTIEKTADGSNFDDDRNFIVLRDKSNTAGSTVVMRLYSGQSGTFTALNHHASSYFLSDFADYGQLWGSGKGLILRAGSNSGSANNGAIRFMTGFRPDGGSNERMIVSANGNIGIGTSDPKAKLHLEDNTTGNESSTFDTREYLRIQNNSTSNGSAASLSITAGANAGSTYLWHVAPSYTPRPQDQDFTILYSSGKGMSFWNSPKGNTANGGYFKFQTGVKPDNSGGFDRLVINNVGNVGIGNSDPKAKLEVKDGDVYVNDPTKGIILKSPNGNCWRVTVDNTGNFVRTAITCPN